MFSIHHGINCHFSRSIWEFPGSPVVRNAMLLLLRALVQSLVRELRSYKLCSVAKKIFFLIQFRSVAQSCDWAPQHTRPPCPSPTPGVHPNPCPLSQWCHPTISSSVVPFSCPQSFPASGSFQMSQLFVSGDQSVRVSTSVLPMNTQDWSPLGWTGWISLQSKGLSKVFSNTTVQKHQFFCAQLSL